MNGRFEVPREFDSTDDKYLKIFQIMNDLQRCGFRGTDSFYKINLKKSAAEVNSSGSSC